MPCPLEQLRKLRKPVAPRGQLRASSPGESVAHRLGRTRGGEDRCKPWTVGDSAGAGESLEHGLQLIDPAQWKATVPETELGQLRCFLQGPAHRSLFVSGKGLAQESGAGRSSRKRRKQSEDDVELESVRVNAVLPRETVRMGRT